MKSQKWYCAPLTLTCTLCAFCAISSSALGQPGWSETDKITGLDSNSNDYFGVAVDVDQGIAIIGARRDESGTGSAYLFESANATQIHKLTADDGAISDAFGAAVGISGNRVIIGAWGDENESGAAYLFDVESGAQLFKLSLSEAYEGDWFGWSVAIYGDRAIVGCPHKDDLAGAAYVYDVSTGQELHKLSADDAESLDEFGFSVDVHDGIAVIGAYVADGSGAAYLFDIETGQQLHKLSPSNGSYDDAFGYDVGIHGDRAVVGAFKAQGEEYLEGAAYVYDVSSGAELFLLKDPDAQEYDFFGRSVAIDGPRVVVGEDTLDYGGSAFVFDAYSGEQLQELTASDGPGGRFGAACAVDGGTLVVGAYSKDTGRGAAYFFNRIEFVVNPEPLRAAHVATFDALDCRPGKRAWLLYSIDGLGQTYIPRLNVFVELTNPQLISARSADSNGDVRWHLTMPDTSTRVYLAFQIAQKLHVTNTVSTHIEP